MTTGQDGFLADSHSRAVFGVIAVSLVILAFQGINPGRRGRGCSSSQTSRAVEPTGEASNPDRERVAEKKSRQEAAGGVFSE